MINFAMDGDRIGLSLISKEAIDGVIDFYQRNKERIERFNPEVHSDYFTRDFWETQFRFRNSTLKRGRAVDFFMFLPEYPTRVVGHIRIFNIESSPRFSCEIGFTVDGLLEGRGYMHEALGLAMRFIRDGLMLHRIVAYVNPGNDKSLKLLSSLGFESEGTARESMQLRNEWIDMARYSLLL